MVMSWFIHSWELQRERKKKKVRIRDLRYHRRHHSCPAETQWNDEKWKRKRQGQQQGQPKVEEYYDEVEGPRIDDEEVEGEEQRALEHGRWRANALYTQVMWPRRSRAANCTVPDNLQQLPLTPFVNYILFHILYRYCILGFTACVYTYMYRDTLTTVYIQ